MNSKDRKALVEIHHNTSHNPISLIGEMAGICYNSDTSTSAKNYKRGLNVLANQHGRTYEFPEVYLIMDGYSARVFREWYTHIGGAPTRLQESTRYVDYSGNGFDYIIPDSISKDPDAAAEWDILMEEIQVRLKRLHNVFHIPNEDLANGLPLGMRSKVICKINLRTLIDMSHQRMCATAYWEYRKLFRDIAMALADYDSEWKYLVAHYFVPKCGICGYCSEGKRTCGRAPLKEQYDEIVALGRKSYFDLHKKE